MASRKRATRASNGGGGSSSTEREQRTLECQLTDAEFKDRSDKMAAEELKIERLKEERKGVNGKIAAAADERGRLAHIIDTRIETRPVECEWRKDFKQNVKRLIRLDKNTEVDTRPMDADDLQTDLGLSLPPVDSDAAPAAPAKRGRGRPKKSAAPVMHAH